MKKYGFLLLVYVIVILACNKPDSSPNTLPFPLPKNKFFNPLNTGVTLTQWKHHYHYYNGLFDDFSDPCERDDTFYFGKNGAFRFSGGSEKCKGKYSFSGTYTFDNRILEIWYNDTIKYSLLFKKEGDSLIHLWPSYKSYGSDILVLKPF